MRECQTDKRIWAPFLRTTRARPDRAPYSPAPLSRTLGQLCAAALALPAFVALGAEPSVVINNPVPPPSWALAQRLLLRTASEAAEEFADRYLDDRGFLKCVERWGGNDGADDAMENFRGWTLLHAVGGDDSVLELYKKAWEGHIRQYTLARAPGIEMAEHGMYWREFVTSFDWEHTGEALAAFLLYGLARPDDPTYRMRTERFARFYTGDDPLAENYDRDLKIIKSLHNGSRGPKLTPASQMDWGGLPVEGAPVRLSRYSTASNIRGDHPLNLCATALGFNAFALTGERRYRDWTVEYAEAWRNRVLANDGNIPTNIGLDGTIGGEWDGKWYGGVFGWDFWPETSGRNYFMRGPRIAFGIGLLLTGDREFMEPLRRQISNLYSASRTEGDNVLLPRKHGDNGFYGYTGNQHLDVQRDVYLFTFDRRRLDGLVNDPWVRYLDGQEPEYPLRALQEEIGAVRSRLSAMRSDESVDYQRPSDHTQQFNPAVTGALVRLMLGGNEPGGSGNILHARLFYFDPVRSRSGVPDQVAALVDRIDRGGVRLRLVNLDPLAPRRIVVQAGAYGEHRFTSVRSDVEVIRVEANRFEVLLGGGAGGTLEIDMDLFVNQPRFRRLP